MCLKDAKLHIFWTNFQNSLKKCIFRTLFVTLPPPWSKKFFPPPAGKIRIPPCRPIFYPPPAAHHRAQVWLRGIFFSLCDTFYYARLKLMNFPISHGVCTSRYVKRTNWKEDTETPAIWKKCLLLSEIGMYVKTPARNGAGGMVGCFSVAFI